MALSDVVTHGWELDEASGTRAATIGSVDLAPDGTLGSTTGKHGAAPAFDRSAGFQASADEEVIGPSESFSLAVWVHPDTAETFSRDFFIFREGPFSSDFEERFYLRWHTWNNDGVSFTIKAEDGTSHGVNLEAEYGALDDNGSTFLVMAWFDRAGGEIGVQINDETPVTTSVPTDLDLETSTSNNYALEFGKQGSEGYFEGWLDEAVIAKGHAWTAQDRSDLWNGGSGVAVSSIAGASATTYALTGTVTEDDDTTAIDGATVTWEMSDGTVLDTGTTDANGDYSLSAEIADGDLPDDTEVTVSADGFTSEMKQETVSTSSTSYVVDFSLADTGGAVSVSQDATSTVTTTGYDATVQTGTPVTVSQDATSTVTTTGYDATVVSQDTTVSQDATSTLTTTGYDATVTTTSGVTVSQDATSSLTTTGHNATVQTGPAVTASQDATSGLTTTGHDASVQVGPAVSVAQDSTSTLTTTGHNATVFTGVLGVVSDMDVSAALKLDQSVSASLVRDMSVSADITAS